MCQKCQTSKRAPPTTLQSLAKSGCRYLKGQEYLVIVDYFSRYPEVQKLKSTTTQSIVNTLKAAFARHSIPEILRSDNGPQFSSQEFKSFANKYNFQQNISRPHFPSSNGQAERAVQTVKNLLKNSTDPFVALLSYRATRDLPDIPDNTDTWITTNGNPIAGRTVQMAQAPQSYFVQTPSGQTQRNVNPTEEHSHSPIVTRSHIGTLINPPEQLNA